MGLSQQEVLKQSEGALAQWEEKWRKHSKINGEIFKERGVRQRELMFKGIGKTGLLIAYAPSLEDNIDIVKKYKDNDGLEIICVDKAFKSLVDNGIIPDYVLLCDAGVDYNKWLKPCIDKTKNVTLLSNINGNPDWTSNWKGPINFFVNKDNIQSEKIFSGISGCTDIIPAGSNVGNSVVIFAGGVLKYDQFLLLGYDFCWGDDDNYYAFDDSDKRYWMKQLNAIDSSGRMVSTSSNLLFSSRWLVDFYKSVIYPSGARLYNCSGKGLLGAVPMVDLEKKLSKVKKRELNPMEKEMILNSKVQSVIIDERNGGEKKLKEVMEKYNIKNVQVNYIPKEEMAWLN